MGEIMSDKLSYKCIYCNNIVDKETEKYILFRNKPVHESCREAYDSIHTLCKKKFGSLYVRKKVDAQIKEITDAGHSTIEIYRALLWWFDIKKSNPEDCRGSIRIVNYIWKDVEEYYLLKSKNRNRNLNVSFDFVEEGVDKIKVERTKFRKPKRIKLFDLK